MIRAAGCQVVNDSAAANLLKIERVQKWTGKNSTVQDWTQRTVYRIIRNRNKLRFTQK